MCRCGWSRNLENEEVKARYRAAKIQPQWVVTAGEQQTLNINLCFVWQWNAGNFFIKTCNHYQYVCSSLNRRISKNYTEVSVLTERLRKNLENLSLLITSRLWFCICSREKLGKHIDELTSTNLFRRPSFQLRIYQILNTVNCVQSGLRTGRPGNAVFYSLQNRIFHSTESWTPLGPNKPPILSLK